MIACPNATPRLRITVESVRSRCIREIGSFALRWLKMAFASPRFPSAFSKSIGFTLCGMVDDPTSPLITRCLKYPFEMYVHMSRAKSSSTVLNRSNAWKSSAMKSCGSICVTYGLCDSPSDSTNLLANVGQSESGQADTCALYEPTAPAILPRISTASTALSWARSRCATLASSFPMVVGVAGCPCVCESIGTSANWCACSTTLSMMSCITGTITSRRASRSISA
mmetsp:Transcript_3534/g.7542  ORF Transcript_3534/g.7542 Transcript_3534/m.7542 type:complete len:225 (-) Transcript_3534:484-1158(-)